MTPEQHNLCREIIRAVLFHARDSETQVGGYRSTMTLCFVEDERKEMERILYATHDTMHD